jgi:hypothetical protein
MSFPAGWYPQDDGRQRYWDGELWTESYAPGVGPAHPDSGTATVPDSTRKARLAQAVQLEVIAGGRIEAQGEFNAIIRFGNPVNHVLHLILTLVTCGVWSLVWLILFIISQTSRRTVTLNVDEYGNVVRQQI